MSHTQQPLHQACEGPQNPPEHGPPARREELAAQVLSQRTRGPASGETGRLHGTTCLYKIGGGGGERQVQVRRGLTLGQDLPPATAGSHLPGHFPQQGPGLTPHRAAGCPSAWGSV